MPSSAVVAYDELRPKILPRFFYDEPSWSATANVLQCEQGIREYIESLASLQSHFSDLVIYIDSNMRNALTHMRYATRGQIA